MNVCSYCKTASFVKSVSLKNHQRFCRDNPARSEWVSRTNGWSGKSHTSETKVRIAQGVKGSKSGVGRKHSEETKRKISESRKKFLTANPDMVPYKLNHYSKGLSYPEKYFKDLFEKEGIVLEFQYRVWLYALDFADPARKIDIEIHGSQHFCDPRIVKSDIRRRQYLEDRGWRLIEINWSNYKRLSYAEKQEVIKNIKEFNEE